MKEKIQKVIEKIRPALQRDGGDLEFVSVDEAGVVKVRLRGACSCCPMSQLTLKAVVEKTIKQEIPEVKSVETV